MAEVYTSRWAEPLLKDVAAQMVGISRGVPRWRTPYRYKMLRELAPSREAFGIEDRHEFETAYQAGLEEIGLDAILGRLERISAEAGGKPVVCLCFEDLSKPGQWCHRTVLARLLGEEAGIEVPELRAGMLAKRPDAPQPALFD